ncbi:MAG: MFS transporter [Chloroflexi bacterium]|nr:MAG: MFS transporter [Chloroflexota bacterium]MBL1194023.1 DHA2 family efflux MFS transporter permease subunit [Chloroflexota bacterium]NOH11317.1 MFS transporter [Chloroflexota bacterium]
MQASQAVDYSRKWYVMAAVGMSLFLATVDGSIVNVSLPTLVRELQTDFPTVQWVVLAYLLTQTTLMLSVGRLGDMIGKKQIFTAGFVVFTIGSVLCGFSPTVHWLIAFRVVQAVGASMVLALGFAIVTESFPPQERGRALGINGSLVSIGIVTGPVLGGFIIENLNWHWIFFVNLPIGIIGTIMALRFIPDFHPEGGQRFDFAGAITLFISLLALLLGLTLGQNLGLNDPLVLVLLAVWVLFLFIFIYIEMHAEQPMIDLHIFRTTLFTVNISTGLLTFICIAGALILVPFYLENVLGFTTQKVGILFAIVPIAMGITAPISGSLSDRFGTRPITITGLLVIASGYLAMTTLSTDTSEIGYLLRMAPIGIGMGIFQSPNNSAIMGAVPNERLGIASGLLSITRTLGQTTGIALLGAFWAFRTLAYNNAPLPGGATTASPVFQLGGMQDTFLVTASLIGLALFISFVGLQYERRAAQATA